MTENGNHRRTTDKPMHKVYLTAIGILWSALVAVASFSAGSGSQAKQLQAHSTGGHVGTQTTLKAIQRQLTDIKADVREIRTAIDGN